MDTPSTRHPYLYTRLYLRVFRCIWSVYHRSTSSWDIRVGWPGGSSSRKMDNKKGFIPLDVPAVVSPSSGILIWRWQTEWTIIWILVLKVTDSDISCLVRTMVRRRSLSHWVTDRLIHAWKNDNGSTWCTARYGIPWGWWWWMVVAGMGGVRIRPCDTWSILQVKQSGVLFLCMLFSQHG
jgi:hypothetical protein